MGLPAFRPVGSGVVVLSTINTELKQSGAKC
jgi:hypothetical protein